ncbi:hypothetical protein, partial [Gordonibacter urolithinfaciens]|uniref:hypothetical protein n=1 Tax=Gordonibacter urolithinfaciens TaxID=1335613 RepID=UPI0015670DFA
ERSLVVDDHGLAAPVHVDAIDAELADRVEEGIARAALSMGAGQVSPDPRGADPCGFCPVLACERRR